jgi:hypothetical protein
LEELGLREDRMFKNNNVSDWPQHQSVFSNVDYGTIYVFVKAVFFSSILSGAIFLFIMETPRVLYISWIDILKFIPLCFLIGLFISVFITLPVSIIAGIFFIPFYNFAILRMPVNLLSFATTGALIFIPAGWILDWHIGFTGFFALAGSIGGAFFFCFDQVEPKRKLSPAQPSH